MRIEQCYECGIEVPFRSDFKGMCLCSFCEDEVRFDDDYRLRYVCEDDYHRCADCGSDLTSDGLCVYCSLSDLYTACHCDICNGYSECSKDCRYLEGPCKHCIEEEEAKRFNEIKVPERKRACKYCGHVHLDVRSMGWCHGDYRRWYKHGKRKHTLRDHRLGESLPVTIKERAARKNNRRPGYKDKGAPVRRRRYSFKREQRSYWLPVRDNYYLVYRHELGIWVRVYGPIRRHHNKVVWEAKSTRLIRGTLYGR